MLLTLIVFGFISFSFLLTSNTHSGSSAIQTLQGTNLLAEVDLASKGLSVISSGSRGTRGYGKVTNYILMDTYLVTTSEKQNILVYDKYTHPAVGADIILEGRSTEVFTPAIEVQGLRILQIGNSSKAVEEFVLASSPVQTL